MTQKEAMKIEGLCMDCGEHTTLGDSCCGAGVLFGGHIYTDDDVEDETKERDPIDIMKDNRERYERGLKVQ